MGETPKSWIFFKLLKLTTKAPENGWFEGWISFLLRCVPYFQGLIMLVSGRVGMFSLSFSWWQVVGDSQLLVDSLLPGPRTNPNHKARRPSTNRRRIGCCVWNHGNWWWNGNHSLILSGPIKPPGIQSSLFFFNCFDLTVNNWPGIHHEVRKRKQGETREELGCVFCRCSHVLMAIFLCNKFCYVCL